MLNETVVVALAFATFIPLVYKPAKNAILNMLDNYTADTIKNIEHAKHMYEQAKHMHDEITKKYNEAEQNAKAIISKANEEANLILAEAKREVEKITAKKTELALARINQQEKHIMEQLKDSIVEQALTNVNEMIAKELDSNAQLSLIDESIKKISKKLVN
jgi:F-type H+-transporting ATPase subunit b